MKNWIVSCLCVILFCSCAEDNVSYSYTLQPTDTFLRYELDSDVRMPLLVRTCMGEKDYLYFQNFSSSELLVYDIPSGSLINRKRFEEEGSNAILGGFLHGFMMTGCDRIFISGLADGRIYETDTTGYIKDEIRFSESEDGYHPLACRDNGKMELLDGKLYLPQDLNFRLGDKVMEGPLMCCVDMETGNASPLPINFPQHLKKERVARGEPTNIAAEHKYCFDGHRFVYSFAYSDDLMVVDSRTFDVSYKPGKSRYVSGSVKVPTFRNTDMADVNRTLLESPAYDNILYDNENKVYYRIVYVPQEIEKDKDLISLIRSGRKQFSVMVYDENFNVIGEDLFPEYAYNPRLSFVYQGSLYISTNHVMSPDYSDDILSFQKMDLVKL